jgi:hypothetical protein
MTEIQTFGNFIEDLPPCEDYLNIGFSAGSRPLQQRWRNNRLSAHFVADYLSTFLPVNDEKNETKIRVNECRGAISYIANELLENAMKFHFNSGKSPVRFGLHFLEIDSDQIDIFLFAVNSIEIEATDKYQHFIQELLVSDPAELYVRQIELSVEDENNQSSGLGLLTMINDYSAKIGWKFERVNHLEAIEVTTLVQISV